MGTFAFSTAAPAKALALVVAASVAVTKGVWSAAVRAHERRQSVAHLSSLDDVFLKDIGLHRSEISSVVYHGRDDISRRPR